jgi:hypothetical protein
MGGNSMASCCFLEIPVPSFSEHNCPQFRLSDFSSRGQAWNGEAYNLEVELLDYSLLLFVGPNIPSVHIHIL